MVFVVHVAVSPGSGNLRMRMQIEQDKQNGMIKIHGGSNWIHFAIAPHPWPSIIETSGMHHTDTIQQYTTQK